MHLAPTPFLTVVDEALNVRLRQTFLGQAHLAGSGPNGARCGGCRHWLDDGSRNSALCGKRFSLLGLRVPDRGASKFKIPREAAACRHYIKGD
jgi:hypothetical protein